MRAARPADHASLPARLKRRMGEWLGPIIVKSLRGCKSWRNLSCSIRTLPARLHLASTCRQATSTCFVMLPTRSTSRKCFGPPLAKRPILSVEQRITNERPVILSSFRAHGWEIEIFGHPRPVREQAGWRHFLVERRLLLLGGDAFRSAVMAERRRGLKSEPAIALALGLSGEPFEALLALQLHSDIGLRELLGRAGFVSPD
jgi:hypothetical protein